MKIRKRAEQKNVVLNNEYYTLEQINTLLETREICYFDKGINQCYEPIHYYQMDETEFRLFTEDLDKLEVVLDEYGHYTTVAIGKNGITYYINL